MRVETPERIVERIMEAARAEPGGVVATDGDGTLWSGDVGDDLFFAMLDAGNVESVAAEAFIREANAHGIDVTGSPVELVRRLHVAFEAGTFPEERFFELMAWSFAGWTRGRMSEFALDVVTRNDVAARLHPELQVILSAVRAAGIEIFLVSASPRAIVNAAASVAGIPLDHVVAADALWNGDTMLADVDRPIPYAAGKVRALEKRIGTRPLYAAFGDSAFDLAMLARSRVPVAIRPKPRLVARAHEVPALVVAEVP
jgi:phosphatidylglycerophosphatase C